MTRLQEEIKVNTMALHDQILSELMEEAKETLNEGELIKEYQLYKTNGILDDWCLDFILDEKNPQNLKIRSFIVDTLKKLDTIKKLSEKEIADLYNNYSYMNGIYLISIKKTNEEENRIEYSIISLKDLLSFFKEANIDVEYKPVNDKTKTVYELTVKATIPTKDEIHTRTLKQNHEHLD